MSEAPAEDACIEPTVAFQQAVADGDAPSAMSYWDELTAEERDQVRTDVTLATVLATFDPLDASSLLGVMGVDVFDAYAQHEPQQLCDLAVSSDPTICHYLSLDPQRVHWFAGRVTAAEYAALMAGQALPPQDQLLATGLLSGAPDWELLILVLDQIPHGDRQLALEEIRAQGQWDTFLSHLDSAHVAMVQGWLGAELGDGTNLTLQQRIDAAVQSERGNLALTAVDGVSDPQNRITPRIRELLILGVALPALEGNDLAREGILSVNAATRAAEALAWMPEREYLRLLLLMEGAGDESRMQQQFLLLEATAARADSFGPGHAAMDALGLVGGSGDLSDLEDFSDSTRHMDRATLIQQTSVTQTTAGDDGMTQKYTDSCGITSIQVSRASADPVEALRMRQDGDLGQDAINSQAGQEQAAVLGASMGGQSVVSRRDYDAVVAAVGQLASSTATAVEQQAVLDFVNGNAFNAANYASGITKLAATVGGAMPGAAAFTAVRNYQISMASTGVGMLTTEVAAGRNGPGDTVETATGQTSADDAPNNIWNDYLTRDTNGDGNGSEVNAVTQAARAGMITPLLNRAARLVQQGVDPQFNVQWDGGGGHFMTFVDVRTDGGRQFLIHDPWTGTTDWRTDAQIISGNFMGTTLGCIVAVEG